MALRRRGAEHIARYSSLLQTLSNALLILEAMNTAVIDHCVGNIDENFDLEARRQVTECFQCGNWQPVPYIVLDR